MKSRTKAILCMALALAGAVLVAAESARPVRRPRRPPTPSGGIIVKESPGNVFCVRDGQSAFTREEVTAALDRISTVLRLPARYVSGDGAMPTNAGATVLLKDELSRKGTTVLAAPEQGWAELATGWLTADSPSAETRARRLYVELMRALGMSVGAGASMYQPCIMARVRSLADLDAIKMMIPGPEGINNIEEGAKTFGINKVRVFTYREACQQGWAPEPTNDVQKAIWDKVHEIPAAPMKIEFDPKKGK